MVSCQKGPTRHAYAWQIGPIWQDTLDIWCVPSEMASVMIDLMHANLTCMHDASASQLGGLGVLNYISFYEASWNCNSYQGLLQ